MSQLTFTSLSIDELYALIIKALGESGMAAAFPKEARELEILKRKRLLTPEEVEKLYGLKAGTLRNKRGSGVGPVYIQESAGKTVYYEHEAIQRYLDKCRKKTYDGE